jgi:hypothetical protein
MLRLEDGNVLFSFQSMAAGHRGPKAITLALSAFVTECGVGYHSVQWSVFEYCVQLSVSHFSVFFGKKHV